METVRISRNEEEMRPVILARAGVPPEQIDCWARSGIPAYQAGSFFQAGLDLEDSTRLHRSGITGSEAKAAVAAGAEPETLAAIRDSSGLSIRSLAAAIAAGADITDLELWLALGFDLERCTELLANGVPPVEVPVTAETNRIIDEAVTNDSEDSTEWEHPTWKATAQRLARDPLTGSGPGIDLAEHDWRAAGFGPWSALAWSIVGVSPDDASEAAHSGLSPLRHVGVAEENEILELRRGIDGPEWVRLDGRALPPTVREILATGDPLAVGYLLLPAIGHLLLDGPTDIPPAMR